MRVTREFKPDIPTFSCLVNLKSPQDPNLFCTSWRYKSSEFPSFLCFENLPRPKKSSSLCFMNLKYIKCPAVMCFGNLTFQHCFAVGNPNCGCVKMEPFILLALFPLFRSYVWSTLRPIPAMRPIVVFLVFPCFIGISAVYGSCPSSPFVSFDPHHGPFHTPNTLKMSNFDANNTIKPGNTNAKKTNGSIFTHVHPNKLMFSSVFVLREPTQPQKIPKFAMCIFGTQVAQHVNSDLQPANSPKHATDAGVQLIWERVLCNSSAMNSPNIFFV